MGYFTLNLDKKRFDEAKQAFNKPLSQINDKEWQLIVEYRDLTSIDAYLQPHAEIAFACAEEKNTDAEKAIGAIKDLIAKNIELQFRAGVVDQDKKGALIKNLQDQDFMTLQSAITANSNSLNVFYNEAIAYLIVLKNFKSERTTTQQLRKDLQTIYDGYATARRPDIAKDTNWDNADATLHELSRQYVGHRSFIAKGIDYLDSQGPTFKGSRSYQQTVRADGSLAVTVTESLHQYSCSKTASSARTIKTDPSAPLAVRSSTFVFRHNNEPGHATKPGRPFAGVTFKVESCFTEVYDPAVTADIKQQTLQVVLKKLRDGQLSQTQLERDVFAAEYSRLKKKYVHGDLGILSDISFAADASAEDLFILAFNNEKYAKAIFYDTKLFARFSQGNPKNVGAIYKRYPNLNAAGWQVKIQEHVTREKNIATYVTDAIDENLTGIKKRQAINHLLSRLTTDQALVFDKIAAFNNDQIKKILAIPKVIGFLTPAQKETLALRDKSIAECLFPQPRSTSWRERVSNWWHGKSPATPQKLIPTVAIKYPELLKTVVRAPQSSSGVFGWVKRLFGRDSSVPTPGSQLENTSIEAIVFGNPDAESRRQVIQNLANDAAVIKKLKKTDIWQRLLYGRLTTGDTEKLVVLCSDFAVLNASPRPLQGSLFHKAVDDDLLHNETLIAKLPKNKYIGAYVAMYQGVFTPHELKFIWEDIIKHNPTSAVARNKQAAHRALIEAEFQRASGDQLQALQGEFGALLDRDKVKYLQALGPICLSRLMDGNKNRGRLCEDPAPILGAFAASATPGLLLTKAFTVGDAIVRGEIFKKGGTKQPLLDTTNEYLQKVTSGENAPKEVTDFADHLVGTVVQESKEEKDENELRVALQGLLQKLVELKDEIDLDASDVNKNQGLLIKFCNAIDSVINEFYSKAKTGKNLETLDDLTPLLSNDLMDLFTQGHVTILRDLNNYYEVQNDKITDQRNSLHRQINVADDTIRERFQGQLDQLPESFIPYDMYVNRFLLLSGVAHNVFKKPLGVLRYSTLRQLFQANDPSIQTFKATILHHASPDKRAQFIMQLPEQERPVRYDEKAEFTAAQFLNLTRDEQRQCCGNFAQLCNVIANAASPEELQQVLHVFGEFIATETSSSYPLASRLVDLYIDAEFNQKCQALREKMEILFDNNVIWEKILRQFLVAENNPERFLRMYQVAPEGVRKNMLAYNLVSVLDHIILFSPPELLVSLMNVDERALVTVTTRLSYLYCTRTAYQNYINLHPQLLAYIFIWPQNKNAARETIIKDKQLMDMMLANIKLELNTLGNSECLLTSIVNSMSAEPLAKYIQEEGSSHSKKLFLAMLASEACCKRMLAASLEKRLDNVRTLLLLPQHLDLIFGIHDALKDWFIQEFRLHATKTVVAEFGRQIQNINPNFATELGVASAPNSRTPSMHSSQTSSRKSSQSDSEGSPAASSPSASVVTPPPSSAPTPA